MSDTFHTLTSADWRSTFAIHRKHPRGDSMRKLIALLLLGAAKLTASQDIALLKAIAQVESGGNAKAVGRNGEKGVYQLKEVVWKQHSDLPFDQAFSETASQLVALKHLKWLRKELQKALGREPIIEELAYAWNAGMGFTSPDYKKRESNARLSARLSYGRRVAALFKEFSAT